MKTFVYVLCLLVCTELAGNAFGASAWPTVNSPEPTVAVAQQMTLNGIPMRIQAFASKRSIGDIVEFYRRDWGNKHVENKLKNVTVLGRATGEFYTTVQVTPAQGGSRVVIAVSHLGGAATRAPVREFQAPITARLLSDMESSDAGKSSRHTVFTNNHSLELNRHRLIEVMEGKGYSLEQEGVADSAHGTALFFRGAGKEAIAVISRAGSETAVVLNTVTHLENSK
ncbi:MAG TPA: hypothetical protein VJ654_20630 [Noviherbaspirillum sp.]|nr:hypothetical protein [Noviherbaspirillum sp.]HJW55783.1 hypothetical protein [Burkholderiaceae bacterium]